MEKLGDKIYRLRKKAGYSQEELSELVGVSRQAVTQWESSNAYPKADRITLLCKYLHTSADALLSDSDCNRKLLEQLAPVAANESPEPIGNTECSEELVPIAAEEAPNPPTVLPTEPAALAPKAEPPTEVATAEAVATAVPVRCNRVPFNVQQRIIFAMILTLLAITAVTIGVMESLVSTTPKDGYSTFSMDKFLLSLDFKILFVVVVILIMIIVVLVFILIGLRIAYKRKIRKKENNSSKKILGKER